MLLNATRDKTIRAFHTGSTHFKEQDDLPTDGPLPRAYVTLPIVQAEVWLQITNAVAWQLINA